MDGKDANRKKSILSVILMMFICLFCIFALSACGSKEKEIKSYSRTKSLYFGSVAYLQDEGALQVFVTMSGNEENKLATTLLWESQKYAQNTFFNCEDIEMSFDASALYDEVAAKLTPDDYLHDGVEYNLLKVVLRYDTIYKSIKSDARILRQGKYYLHCFDVYKEANGQIESLKMKTQNSASWYTLLIACVIVFAVLLIAIYLAIKGKLWQKKMKENE